MNMKLIQNRRSQAQSRFPFSEVVHDKMVIRRVLIRRIIYSLMWRRGANGIVNISALKLFQFSELRFIGVLLSKSADSEAVSPLK